MRNDRSDYRDMDNERLVEEVHYGTAVDWKELAIVLSERLEERKPTHTGCDFCD